MTAIPSAKLRREEEEIERGNVCTGQFIDLKHFISVIFI